MEESGKPALDLSEKGRYQRHLTLPEVGMDGQLALKAARVLIVGVGGLGSPVALYLTAAGVGTLGIADCDTVDISNLQRQILHSTPDVGRPKIESALDRLRALNPTITLIPHPSRITRDNAMKILNAYDIVVDGTDNVATRYLLNDACMLQKKTMVYGAVFRFEGQVSVFAPGEGPCYRCLYPEPPPPWMVPPTSETGILGVLPGLVGMIQATEVIKRIIGRGSSLVGRLVIFNALDMKFQEFRVPRSHHCQMCGDHPSITGLEDSDALCQDDTQTLRSSRLP